MKEHLCKFCGAPSSVDPSDQLPPPDYCHPEDHGDGVYPYPEEQEATLEDCDWPEAEE